MFSDTPLLTYPAESLGCARGVCAPSTWETTGELGRVYVDGVLVHHRAEDVAQVQVRALQGRAPDPALEIAIQQNCDTRMCCACAATSTTSTPSACELTGEGGLYKQLQVPPLLRSLQFEVNRPPIPQKNGVPTSSRRTNPWASTGSSNSANLGAARMRPATGA